MGFRKGQIQIINNQYSMFKEATQEEINVIMEVAWKAFHVYRNMSLKQRADFMRAIAAELEASGDELIKTTMRETNLPETRMKNEKSRTVFQMRQYADACESANVLKPWWFAR